MKAKDLRNSILQMAVQGQLVPQDPNDEPASVLLERIREERHRLYKQGALKFPKGSESIIYTASDGSPYEKRVDARGRVISDECIQDEIPFEIPESWAWARLPDLVQMRIGKTPDRHTDDYWNEGSVPWFSISDMVDGRTIIQPKEYISQRAFKECFKQGVVKAGSLIMSFKLTIGKTSILGIDAVHNEAIVSLIPYLDSGDAIRDYLLNAMPLIARHGDSNDAMKGATLNSKSLAALLIPVPPLAEQKHIAAKVADLTPLVDEYGAFEDAREVLDSALPSKLRQSVLQEAVEGRLVSQNPNDEPASVLLERIRQERRELIAQGKLKFPKDGESIIYTRSDDARYEKRVDARGRVISDESVADEIPFEIPESWTWARLESVGEIVGGGTPKTGDASLWADSVDGVPWLTPADMSGVHGVYVSAGNRYLSQKGLNSSSARLMPAGSVLMSSRAPIGYIAIANNPIATNQGFKSVVPLVAEINVWLYWVIQARMDDIKRRASGTTFMEISGSEFGRTLVPIPPLAEQKRIADKVERVLGVMAQSAV